MSLLSVAGAQSWSPSMRCAPWSPVPSGVGSLPRGDVLVKLPSTSCAVVALDPATRCLVVKSPPSASVGCFLGTDVLASSVWGNSVCFALLVAMSASALCERFLVFSVMKINGVGTFLLVLMVVAAAHCARLCSRT